MNMSWPTGRMGGGGGLSYIEKERGIFICNGPEQMKKKFVIIWSQQTILLFRCMDWYRTRGPWKSLLVCSQQFEAWTHPPPKRKYWPIEDNVEKYETARNWVIIELVSVDHLCKKFPALHKNRITISDRDVTTSLLGLWSLQCAAMLRHVAYKKFTDNSFSPLLYS